MPKPDCTYLYFKPAGRWQHGGRGVFPLDLEVDRDAIIMANEGKMPGIISFGYDYVVVVIPDEDCDAPYAYPRMLNPRP